MRQFLSTAHDSVRSLIQFKSLRQYACVELSNCLKCKYQGLEDTLKQIMQMLQVLVKICPYLDAFHTILAMFGFILLDNILKIKSSCYNILKTIYNNVEKYHTQFLLFQVPLGQVRIRNQINLSVVLAKNECFSILGPYSKRRMTMTAMILTSGTFSTHHKQKNIISTKKVVSIVFYGFC